MRHSVERAIQREFAKLTDEQKGALAERQAGHYADKDQCIMVVWKIRKGLYRWMPLKDVDKEGILERAVCWVYPSKREQVGHGKKGAEARWNKPVDNADKPTT